MKKLILTAIALSLLSGAALASGYGWSRALEGAVEGLDAVERRNTSRNYDYQNPYGNTRQEETRRYQEEHIELLEEQNNLMFMQGGRDGGRDW